MPGTRWLRAAALTLAAAVTGLGCAVGPDYAVSPCSSRPCWRRRPLGEL